MKVNMIRKKAIKCQINFELNPTWADPTKYHSNSINIHHIYLLFCIERNILLSKPAPKVA